MKVIIAGTRPPQPVRNSPVLLSQWYRIHRPLVGQAVDMSTFLITSVVSGQAQGFDMLGEAWARKYGLPIIPFPAFWRDHRGAFNKVAGFERNGRMAEHAEALIAIWDGYSGGTANMIQQMRELGKPLYVHKYSDKDLILKPPASMIPVK